MKDKYPDPCSCSKSLFQAAREGCDECCMKYIDQDVGKRESIHFDRWGIKKNMTALMAAAYYGHTGCVRILAEREAGMQDG